MICAFNDKGITFGILTIIFGYRAMSDFVMETIGSHFQDDPTKTYIPHVSLTAYSNHFGIKNIGLSESMI